MFSLDKNFVKSMYINHELSYAKNEGKLSFQFIFFIVIYFIVKIHVVQMHDYLCKGCE